MVVVARRERPILHTHLHGALTLGDAGSAGAQHHADALVAMAGHGGVDLSLDLSDCHPQQAVVAGGIAFHASFQAGGFHGYCTHPHAASRHEVVARTHARSGAGVEPATYGADVGPQGIDHTEGVQVAADHGCTGVPPMGDISTVSPAGGMSMRMSASVRLAPCLSRWAIGWPLSLKSRVSTPAWSVTMSVRPWSRSCSGLGSARASSSMATSISGLRSPPAGTIVERVPSKLSSKRLVPKRLKPARRRSLASMCSTPRNASSRPPCTTLTMRLPSNAGKAAGGRRQICPSCPK